MLSKPFDITLLCNDQFENLKSDKSEKIPFFLLPYGFQGLSLFQLAQYYDQSATEFFNSFIFSQNDEFNSIDTIDYSKYFNQVQNFQVPESFTSNELIECSDRFFNFNYIFALKTLGSTSYLSFNIPKGKEDSIVHLLSHSRDFSRPHLFSLMASPFNSIPQRVSITIGQPILFNSLMEKSYSNYDSISARQDSIKSEINEMHESNFQIDWAIVSIDGILHLILVRPPQYIRIADGILSSFDTIEEAFEYSHIYFVCYRHSHFINSKFSELSKNSNELKESIKSDSKLFESSTNSNEINESDSILYELSTNLNEINEAIKSDSIFCELLDNKMNDLKISDFQDDLINFIRYPSYFLLNCGFDKNISLAAATFIDNPKGRASSIFIQQIEKDPDEGAPVPVNDLFITADKNESKIYLEKIQIAINEYYKFLFWFRSLINLLKFFHKKDLNRITKFALACFRSLPIRNRYIISSTIIIVIDILKYIRKQRGQTEEFFKNILRIFHCVFGEDFDSVIGLQKWEVPRALRNQVINVDGCVKLFYIKETQMKKKTISNSINRFVKFWNLTKKEIQIDREISFNLSPSFIEFLKIQKFDRSIEI